jgi:hypothetical protein
MTPLPFPLARVGMTHGQAAACILCAPLALAVVAILLAVL